MILVYPSFTIPFATWLLMGFFKTIPQELEDAALVDGCSRLKALLADRLPGLAAGDPDGGDLLVFALRERVHLRVHLHVDRPSERTISAGVPNELIRGDVFFWQSLMAAVLIPTHPACPALQRVPRQVHQGLHRRGIPVSDPKGGRDGEATTSSTRELEPDQGDLLKRGRGRVRGLHVRRPGRRRMRSRGR